MTKLTDTKEEYSSSHLHTEGQSSSDEAEQILHLKRLLVTLKQHYEKSLHTSHIQLQAEQNQRMALQRELDRTQEEFTDYQKRHEEELQAIRNQQVTLKELVKKSQQEAENLQQLLNSQKQADPSLDTVISSNSSHQLRQELEEIKRTLAQGTQEAKALEERYIALLQEKMALETQGKQLQTQIEHQLSSLSVFQASLHELEQQKKIAENTLHLKEQEIADSRRQHQELWQQMQQLNASVREKEYMQDKYEQLKEEWTQLNERLEEAIEARIQAEQQLAHLEDVIKEQERRWHEHEQHMLAIDQGKQELLFECEQLRALLEDSETRLKVAQQHLAKKVKEATLLNERVEEQQVSLNDLTEIVEHQRNLLAQLQAQVEIYQKQEKRLQEQLHEALKGTESQVAKWEEKYFRMYDKWQESEMRVSELKKFEEKHHQMQSLLANLGTFMGGSFPSPSPLLPSGPENAERVVRPMEESPAAPSQAESQEEKYDVFGMRQSSVDKYKTTLFS